MSAMELRWHKLSLPVANYWATSRGGVSAARMLVLELVDHDGASALGETSPILRYGETVESVEGFLRGVDPARLTFTDVASSMAYVASLAPGQPAAKSALSIALHDGAARRAGRPVYDLFGLGFREGVHVTSFSIGIATPEEVHTKVAAARGYPRLKLKLGSADDQRMFEAARAAAPDKPIRVDANEAWRDREQALGMIEWLARDGRVELVEQPMPASTSMEDLAWLFERSPLPLVADESFHGAADVPACAAVFHGVNAKLCKTGGLAEAHEALRRARDAGLRTMLGCMVETSVAISAAAQLAELCDWLDLDGNLLLADDPYEGVTCHEGVLSFADAAEPAGLRVRPRRARA
jgi:L-Ala-D/L-Glu epimerase